MDVSARVRAMKQEFREYKEEMEKKATEGDEGEGEGRAASASPATAAMEESKKLESLI